MKCARCDKKRTCSTWRNIRLCAECVRLIVEEWCVRREEYADLVKS